MKRALLLSLISTPAWAVPDIVLGPLQGVPATTAPNAPFTVQINVSNIGTPWNDPVVTRVSVSTDAVFDNSDPWICEATMTGVTATPWPFAMQCTFPPTPGTYWIVARTAYNMTDANPANNDAVAGPVTVLGGGGTGGQADLVPSSINLPLSVDVNQAFGLNYLINNVGSVSATPSTSRVFLSADGIYDPTDVSVCADAVPGIAQGSQANRILSGCVVPPGAPVGPGYLLVVVDGANQVAESNETNNLISGPITVTNGGTGPTPTPTPAPTPTPNPGGPVDLSVVSLQAPTQATAGETLPLTLTVHNTGSGSVPETAIDLRISTDALFSSNDIQICRPRLGAVAPNADLTSALTGCALPTNALAGDGFLVLRLDATSLVGETDERNNDGSTVIRVVAASVDPIEDTWQVGDTQTDTPDKPVDTELVDTDLPSDTDVAPARPGSTYGTFGCGCQSQRGPWWLLAAPLLWLRRRRLTSPR